ncbi:transposase, partial [Escherichia coli]|nr:transposase [Escherichia coli]EJJ0330489.1 transposase [Escherichia coli]HCQ0487069.1 transposase [Escherichia coli]
HKVRTVVSLSFSISYTWTGRTVVAIYQFFPYSKRCSCCGFTMQKMPPDVRKWPCPECGTDHDRDINAARNIKAAGLAVLAHGEPVNPESHKAAQVRLREVGILALQGGEQSRVVRSSAASFSNRRTLA